jgi:hypothetical protein
MFLDPSAASMRINKEREYGIGGTKPITARKGQFIKALIASACELASPKAQRIGRKLSTRILSGATDETYPDDLWM